ncbi:hypothetical protein HanXRQr2_Chr03g0125801 [Helianthus annuus]|uniref:Uncharacterized protein n=1 Tax=Helianthus annuus TaxID=4232 RepID=A0A9K3JIC3_HELAN|nr:hypothetical protein HanXRQr2_Chr03g0125801 [Helianthus annuus]KAJ0944945.1 hypothetical protein HanPSC8_Chr03g0122421 [Helianthus annuus]
MFHRFPLCKTINMYRIVNFLLQSGNRLISFVNFKIVLYISDYVTSRVYS